MNKKFLFLILGLFMISQVFALGVSPGRTTLDFSSSLAKDVGFEIINTEGKATEVILTVDGDLADYIDFDTTKVSFEEGEYKKEFSYHLNLPVKMDPGLQTGRIVIMEIPKSSESGESSVAATLAVATQLHINVPYPGKYASSSFIVYDSVPGEDITFVFPIISKGEFDLTSVHANVDIYNKANEKVGSFNTQSIEVLSGERKELVYKWESDLQIGEYRAAATLIWDEGTLDLEKSFSIGSKELELQEITVNDFSLGEIVKLEMLVENKWSEVITDAYIETKIMDSDEKVVSSFRSSTYNLEALAKEVFVSYWDTSGVKVGNYATDVAIHYGDKVSRKSLQFAVSENDLTVIGLGYVVSSDGGNGDNSLVIILITVIVVLVLINLLWFLILRKKLGSRK